MNSLKQRLGKRLSRYLSEPGHTAGTAAPTRTDLLAQVLQTGDVLLVEGTSRVSSAIKYLTQSTWSHAALYVGKSATGESQFLEADMVHGVRLVPLAHFTGFHCRVCRPVSLSEAERQTVCNFALARVGLQYDMKNIVDLARYLLPNPPVPMRWRRQMLSLGSGDPTRAICSTLVAEAFAVCQLPDFANGGDAARRRFAGQPARRQLARAAAHPPPQLVCAA